MMSVHISVICTACNSRRSVSTLVVSSNELAEYDHDVKFAKTSMVEHCGGRIDCPHKGQSEAESSI